MDKVQESLDLILELSEGSLNEGDYITVSNNLKEIYDYVRKPTDAPGVILPTNHTSRLYSIPEQRDDHVSFRLTLEEQYNIVKERLFKTWTILWNRLKSELNDLKNTLRLNNSQKKANWVKLKEIRGRLKSPLLFEERLDLLSQQQVELNYRKNQLLICNELLSSIVDCNRRISVVNDTYSSRMLLLEHMLV